MKKILTLFLAAAMLAASVPASLAGETTDKLTLDSASVLTVAEDGYIDNLADGVSVAELVANFRDKKNVTVTDKSGKVLSLTDTVGSDAVVSYASGDLTAKTWMLGDVTGDAQINTKDAAQLVRDQAGYGMDICRRAADANSDGSVNAKDVARLLQYIAGWSVTIAKPAYAGIAAPDEDAGMKIYFTDLMDRIGQSVIDIADGSLDRIYYMAKNEHETAQIVLTSDIDRKDLSIEIGDLVNENGDVLSAEHKVGYYYKFEMLDQLKGSDWTKTTEDSYVEPLIPMSDTFEIGANQSKIFVVIAYTEKDCAPGFYKADVNVKDADGKIIKTAVLRFYVWDFALDEKPASAGAFGIDRYNVATNLADDTLQKMMELELVPAIPNDYDLEYERWYNYLIDNRIPPSELPYGNVEDPRNEKYIKDPRVTQFQLHGDEGYTYQVERTEEPNYAFFTDMIKRHADDENWLSKAFIYTVDEPSIWDQMDYLDAQWKAFKEALGDIPFRVVTPLATDVYDANNPEQLDFAERVANSTTILCPQTRGFTPFATKEMRAEDPDKYPTYAQPFSTKFIVNQFGDYPDRYKEWQEDGKHESWWYICVAPTYPYANFFTSYAGVCNRVVLWQQYMNNVDGLLYWCVNFWNIAEHESGRITLRKTNSGDGNLIYPNAMFKTTEFCPSVRFEYVRDGLEDFQYMEQLERAVGRDAVMSQFIDNVTTGMLQFTEDHTVLAQNRDRMGFVLESVSGN